jgi:uncharacterized radical SAM protein YgiQ
MDSMVNHYTANKRLRSDDAYSPDGKAGFRPDYAVSVYGKILKKLFPEVPLVIGGIEASLRRLTHYDYWSDTLKPSVLVESGADLLVWGMGERPILEIARRLSIGDPVTSLRDIPQTAFCTNLSPDQFREFPDREKIRLHSFEDCLRDKKMFAQNFKFIEEDSNKMLSSVILEPVGKQMVVVNPSDSLIPEKELDAYYDLPFTRLPHPRYKNKVIPAYEMIRFSVTSHRGCFGGCSFCTISAHQGKFISSRSESSIVSEIDEIASMESFKGYVSDLGGPSANMYGMKGRNQALCEKCRRASCLFPVRCKNLDTSHERLLALYRKARERKGIKKIFIGSGIRYDLFLSPQGEFNTSVEKVWFQELLRFHVSGRLKVAPEHTSDKVLQWMRKPSFNLFRHLNALFEKENRKEDLRQQLVPYFISGHPGCTLQDMKDLSEITRKLRFHLEQVQDFTPTPMTLSSVIFYTGIDPYTGNPVYVAKSKEEKMAQKQCFFPGKY